MEKHRKINRVKAESVDDNSLIKLWQEAGTNFQLLAISGVAGAIFRTIFSPEKEFWRRVVQGFGGALCAIFLGGWLASFINNINDFGFYSYLAAGFIMGTGGETLIKTIQEKMISPKK